MGNSVTLTSEQPSAAPPAAPERKVMKKVVRRRKGTPRTTSPTPTSTGDTAAEARPGRDTVEGDSLSESHVQLLEMVLYYVSDTHPDRGEKLSDMIRSSVSGRLRTHRWPPY